jgi:hypothetical protein
MEINKEKIIKGRNKKSIFVSIKISQKVSDWLKEKNYSPTGIFVEAINSLGFESEQKEN